MPIMTEISDDQLFAELRKIDTPTITNVVATYPKNPLCLGLYNPWTENWYTDTSIRCIYPEMGAIVGYAVTCVYGLPDPNYSGRLSFMDVIDALDAMKKPTVLVIQQKWPPELMAKAGLAGEMVISSMMAVGCVGMQRAVARRRCDPEVELSVAAGWSDCRSRRDGGAVSQRPGVGRRYGRSTRRTDPHG
jgi:hypothetical protein